MANDICLWVVGSCMLCCNGCSIEGKLS